MKCFDFANRINLIPLPTVIRGVVDGYLGDDLIPSRIVDVPENGRVVMIDGQDVYYRLGSRMYKNTDIIYDHGDYHICNMQWYIYPLIGDWILFNECLYNTSTRYAIRLNMKYNSGRVFRDDLYFIFGRDVMRLPLRALKISELNAFDIKPEKVRENVSMLDVIGDCLVFTDLDGHQFFHDCDIRYKAEYIYLWNHHVYKITLDGISCNGNFLMKFNRESIMTMFAVNETVLIDTIWNRYVLDCDTRTCQKMNRLQVLNEQPDRLWVKTDDKLFIYY